MKKTTLALLAALSVGAVNAEIFIDDHAMEVRKEAISKVTKSEPKEVKKVKTTNKVSTINYEQQISVFHHIGKKQSTEKLKGFANDITVKEALENIVPEEWKIEVNDKVNLAKKVNFAGGETWNDTVERVGKDNFSATFNWADKTLRVVPVDTRYKADTVTSTENLTDKKVAHKARPHKVAKVKSTKATSTKAENVSVTDSAGNWLLSKKYTLKQNVEMWGKKAGWTVVWRAPDYNVVADARFSGAIDSENGPVISVLRHYEDSNLPLRVNIMGGNKVINVESRNYVPKDAVDLSLDIQ